MTRAVRPPDGDASAADDRLRVMGPRVQAVLLRVGSGVAALLLVAAAALILLPVPAIWFTRWIPWALIVRVGTIGNRVGPFLLAGPLVGLLAWDAEHPAPRRRGRGPIGGAGRWSLSIATLFALVMAVIVFTRS